MQKHEIKESGCLYEYVKKGKLCSSQQKEVMRVEMRKELV